MWSLTILVFLILWLDYYSPNIWNLKCSKKRSTFWAQNTSTSRKLHTALTMKKHNKTTNVLKVLYIFFYIFYCIFFSSTLGYLCVYSCLYMYGHTQVTVHLWRSKENLMRVNSLLLCRFWGSNSGLQTTWQATSWAILLTVFETRPFVYQYVAKSELELLPPKCFDDRCVSLCLHLVLGTEHRTSCTFSKYSIDWALFPSSEVLKYNIVYTQFLFWLYMYI